MCQETQNWHDYGFAGEIGWGLLQEEQEGKAGIASQGAMKGMGDLLETEFWTCIVLE